MSATAAFQVHEGRTGAPQPWGTPALLLGVALAAILLSQLVPWAARWPEIWTLPVREWGYGGPALARPRPFVFGWFSFRDLTRGIASVLAWPLDMAEGVLFAGFRRSGVPPVPWIAIGSGVVLLGHFLGGRRLAILCGVAVLYVAVFGLWADAMRTLSLVVVTVPLAAATGLLLGIAAFKSATADRVLRVLFDLMQAIPHMAYLGPVAVFFGFGPVAAMLASALFALAPMARCVLLGLRTIPANVVEAGLMCGCSQRQLLWLTQLPAALPGVLVGLNQVVMQVLAMAVISSLIGATGLGHRLLVSLQQLQLGRAVEYGVAIVLIAIVLDRLTQAWAKRTAVHRPRMSWLTRHKHLTAFLLVLAAAYALRLGSRQANQLPKAMTVTTAPFLGPGDPLAFHDVCWSARRVP
jgi:glycine betaine/proline transport system permease protein